MLRWPGVRLEIFSEGLAQGPYSAVTVSEEKMGRTKTLHITWQTLHPFKLPCPMAHIHKYTLLPESVVGHLGPGWRNSVYDADPRRCRRTSSRPRRAAVMRGESPDEGWRRLWSWFGWSNNNQGNHKFSIIIIIIVIVIIAHLIKTIYLYSASHRVRFKGSRNNEINNQ